VTTDGSEHLKQLNTDVVLLKGRKPQ
jgi:hypothetical protein